MYLCPHMLLTNFLISLHLLITYVRLCHGNQCLTTFRLPVKTGFCKPVTGFGKNPVLTSLFVIIAACVNVCGPAAVMVRVVRPSLCLSHANISESKRNKRMHATRKLEQESGLPDPESAIRFAIRSTIPS